MYGCPSGKAKPQWPSPISGLSSHFSTLDYQAHIFSSPFIIPQREDWPFGIIFITKTELAEAYDQTKIKLAPISSCKTVNTKIDVLIEIFNTLFLMQHLNQEYNLFPKPPHAGAFMHHDALYISI